MGLTMDMKMNMKISEIAIKPDPIAIKIIKIRSINSAVTHCVCGWG